MEICRQKMEICRQELEIDYESQNMPTKQKKSRKNSFLCTNFADGYQRRGGPRPPGPPLCTPLSLKGGEANRNLLEPFKMRWDMLKK